MSSQSTCGDAFTTIVELSYSVAVHTEMSGTADTSWCLLGATALTINPTDLTAVSSGTSIDVSAACPYSLVISSHIRSSVPKTIS